jgi:hypothetical protein
VVGKLDNLSLFSDNLRKELGVRIRIGHENSSRRSSLDVKKAITPEVRQKIIELCQPDIQVWESICE